MEMCDALADSMDKAKIGSDNFYLFSATRFSQEIIGYTEHDERFTLIDMNEL